MKLADDFNKFKDVVSKTPSGLNRDTQEGGLDALAQVLTCKNVIGWRNESRKIVVFLTEGPYHTAGDGKTAGLSKPYDGKCYTENGTYTKELEMDYPSVGMINKLATESDITVIFVVESHVYNVYYGLNKAISGSRLTKFNRIGKGTDDEMIVNILKDIYTVSVDLFVPNYYNNHHCHVYIKFICVIILEHFQKNQAKNEGKVRTEE